LRLVILKIKVGVIGAGHQGVIHLERYLTLSDKVEVVALCDSDQNALDRACEKYRIEKQFTDYMDLMEEDLDAVSICSPNFLHKSMAIAAIEADKHTLLEKPIGLNLNEAEEVVSKTKRSGVKVMVAFDQLFNPMIQKTHSLIENGVLGQLAIGTIERYANYSQTSRSEFGWRSDIEKVGGGALIESGIHKISLLYYLMGKVDSVIAFSRKLSMNIDAEDNIVLLANHRNKAIGSVICSWTSELRGPEQDRISIFGDKGSVIAYGSFHKGTGFMEFSDSSVRDYSRTLSWYPQSGTTREEYRSARMGYDCYQIEINHFIDCVLNDKTPVVTCEDARNIQEIAEAAYESVRTQHVTTIPDRPQ
jgi:predicted dehydrogenase